MTLKEHCIARGVKQNFIARQIKRSRETVSAYYNGRRIPDYPTQVLLEQVTYGDVKAGVDWPNGKERQ